MAVVVVVVVAAEDVADIAAADIVVDIAAVADKDKQAVRADYAAVAVVVAAAAGEVDPVGLWASSLLQVEPRSLWKD